MSEYLGCRIWRTLESTVALIAPIPKIERGVARTDRIDISTVLFVLCGSSPGS